MADTMPEGEAGDDDALRMKDVIFRPIISLLSTSKGDDIGDDILKASQTALLEKLGEDAGVVRAFGNVRVSEYAYLYFLCCCLHSTVYVHWRLNAYRVADGTSIRVCLCVCACASNQY